MDQTKFYLNKASSWFFSKSNNHESREKLKEWEILNKKVNEFNNNDITSPFYNIIDTETEDEIKASFIKSFEFVNEYVKIAGERYYQEKVDNTIKILCKKYKIDLSQISVNGDYIHCVGTSFNINDFNQF